MIKKLRRKFIIFAELSIFALLAVILVSINVANFVMVANDADTITQILADNKGAFPVREGGQEGGPIPPEQTSQTPQFNEGPMGPRSPETKDSVRFFSIKINADGTATPVERGFHINAVAEEEAIAWAKTLSSKSVGWTRTYYRFRAYTPADEPTTRYVTVIDQGRELSPSYRVLYASLIGSGVGLVVSLLILFFVAKQFVKPLEISDKKQRRFISDASHELKTPLTIISANAELLELEHGENENVAAIVKQVGHLTNMVRDLNDLARVGEKTEKSKFDIATIADEMFRTFETSFQAKNIKATSNLPTSLEFESNEGLVRKLLSIVLENASKYALSYVNFSVKSEQSRAIIICKNDANLASNGPMDKVFERFYRSDEARGSSIEGSGIGLSIAKEIVTTLNGRIYAYGEGKEFILKTEL